MASETVSLQDRLADPTVFRIYIKIQSKENKNSTVFLALFDASQEGKLDSHGTFQGVCEVFSDRLPVLPGMPIMVVALLPTNGKETGPEIHQQQLVFLKMAATTGLSVVSCASDGAATEMAAQTLMEKEVSHGPPVMYDYPLFGLHLQAPVFETTGPLVSFQDPPHFRKTTRNQAQHGTKTMTLGVGCLIMQSLIDLYSRPGSGLLLRDVLGDDKQDDTAARRFYTHQALSVLCEQDPQDVAGKKLQIIPGQEALFVWLFIFGTEFVEHFFGLARMMLPNFAFGELLNIVWNVMVCQRILMTGDFKERCKKESQSGYSFDHDSRLLSEDQLLKLRVTLTREDINILVRIAYREAAEICKQILRIRVRPIHVDAPLRLYQASTGVVRQARHKVRDGDKDDSEADNIDPDEALQATNKLPTPFTPLTPADAAIEVAHSSALDEDFDAADEELQLLKSNHGTPPQNTFTSFSLPCSDSPTTPLPLQSYILDEYNHVHIAGLLKERGRVASPARNHSQRSVHLDPKYALAATRTHQDPAFREQINDAQDTEEEWPVMTPQEGFQHTCNLHEFTLTRGSFLLMHTEKRFYIGKVLNMFKRGIMGARYGWVPNGKLPELTYLSLRVYFGLGLEANKKSELEYKTVYKESGTAASLGLRPLASRFQFTRYPIRDHDIKIHTHAHSNSSLYYIGHRPFTRNDQRALQLTPEAAKAWEVFTRPKVAERLIRVRFPGGSVTFIN
ncbi:hypothetical protein CONPUDRAFT_155464 [Coniophora puteana RWD-64-598 SS2]|uniref:Uncharacterized protein n=1 Tax=Coniophora puteana (strain RWD-64-598) TaxID=741705 RepID=A0A5M3MM27_CONPW|nr:uncharacterized protein CONPUDRAFT_155464 [Coniophora puteana RWD-64-598 SS2]EIW80096.1 hypothetical protein CONPUDRAFT_155464 [Coniophora puteana RWD-64-598 SS2]